MATGTQEISAVRGLSKFAPLPALALVTGGLAIAGAPPFAVFISEFLIFKAGFVSGQYLVVGLLALFVVIAFCAVMFHVNRMAFGVPNHDHAVASCPSLARLRWPLPELCWWALAYMSPSTMQALLRSAAASMGG